MKLSIFPQLVVPKSLQGEISTGARGVLYCVWTLSFRE